MSHQCIADGNEGEFHISNLKFPRLYFLFRPRLHEHGSNRTVVQGFSLRIAMFRYVHSSRASQFRAKIRRRFQIDAVSPFTYTRTSKPYRIENAPLLTAFSQRTTRFHYRFRSVPCKRKA